MLGLEKSEELELQFIRFISLSASSLLCLEHCRGGKSLHQPSEGPWLGLTKRLAGQQHTNLFQISFRRHRRLQKEKF